MSKYDFRNWLYTNVAGNGQLYSGEAPRFKFAPNTLYSTLFRPSIVYPSGTDIQGAGVVPNIASAIGMHFGTLPLIASEVARQARGLTAATFGRRPGEGWGEARSRSLVTPLQGTQAASEWLTNTLSPTFEQNMNGTVDPARTAKLLFSNLIRPTITFGERFLRYANPVSKPEIRPQS